MRCFIQPTDWAAPELWLDAAETRHAVQVLRKRVGDELDLLDGAGGGGRATILELRRDAARLRVLEHRQAPRPPVELVLIQALPREQRMDLILQKATELGAAAIVPVQTAHCVVQVRPAQAAEKAERWRQIARNAAKQSGALWLPQIAPPQPLTAYLAGRPAFDLLLVGALTGATRPLREALAEARAHVPAPRRIGALVGPEGDFTAEELAAALAAGATPVSLGPTVLRVETAALCLLSILRHEFGT